MPYRQSTARVEFQTKLRGLNALAKVVSTITKGGVRQLALQGVVMQAHAMLELYVLRVLEDWCYERSAVQQPTSELPEATRKWLFHKLQEALYARYLIDGDEKRLLSFVDLTSPKLNSLVTGNGHFRITAAEIFEDKGYPSIENLQALFKRIGMDNLRAYFGAQLRTSADDYFKGISSVRTSIAHRNADPLVLRDVRIFSARLRRVVMILDGAFYDRLCSVPNSNVWK